MAEQSSTLNPPDNSMPVLKRNPSRRPMRNPVCEFNIQQLEQIYGFKERNREAGKKHSLAKINSKPGLRLPTKQTVNPQQKGTSKVSQIVEKYIQVNLPHILNKQEQQSPASQHGLRLKISSRAGPRQEKFSEQVEGLDESYKILSSRLPALLCEPRVLDTERKIERKDVIVEETIMRRTRNLNFNSVETNEGTILVRPESQMRRGLRTPLTPLRTPLPCLTQNLNPESTALKEPTILEHLRGSFQRASLQATRSPSLEASPIRQRTGSTQFRRRQLSRSHNRHQDFLGTIELNHNCRFCWSNTSKLIALDSSKVADLLTSIFSEITIEHSELDCKYMPTVQRINNPNIRLPKGYRYALMYLLVGAYFGGREQLAKMFNSHCSTLFAEEEETSPFQRISKQFSVVLDLELTKARDSLIKLARNLGECCKHKSPACLQPTIESVQLLLGHQVSQKPAFYLGQLRMLAGSNLFKHYNQEKLQGELLEAIHQH